MSTDKPSSVLGPRQQLVAVVVAAAVIGAVFVPVVYGGDQ